MLPVHADGTQEKKHHSYIVAVVGVFVFLLLLKIDLLLISVLQGKGHLQLTMFATRRIIRKNNSPYLRTSSTF